MVNDTIWLALIVAVPAMLSPLLLSLLTNRNRRLEKQEDYARQDEVARQASEAASKAAEKTEDVARQLRFTNQQVADNAKTTIGKLDVIHALVNSNMTSAMQSEFDATTRELALMREVVELKKVAGHGPTVEVLAAIETTTRKISELHAALADRMKQT